MKHVCILSAAHPAEDGRVTHKIGKGLKDAGVRVTWVGPGAEPARVDHGIEFVLLGGGGGMWARLARREALVKAAARLERVDVWFGVEPDSAMSAVRLARLRGGRAVFDVHEVYHDDMLKDRVPQAMKPLAGALVKWQLDRICRACDLVVGAGVTRIEPFLKVARKTMVIRHCLSVELARQEGGAPFDGTREYVRIMHGKATVSHGTLELLEAAAYVKRRGGPRLRLLMFKTFNPREGFGFSEAVQKATELGVADMIEWHDPVPFQRMFDLMRTCDLAVIGYTQKMGRNCMPNRIFEYMAFGIPVVCPSYARELEAIVSETACGVLVDMGRADSLGEAILRLCTDRKSAQEMGCRGRRAFVESYNMERELVPFLEWIGVSDPTQAAV